MSIPIVQQLMVCRKSRCNKHLRVQSQACDAHRAHAVPCPACMRRRHTDLAALMPVWVCAVAWAGAAWGLGGLAGCASKPRPAADTALTQQPDEPATIGSPSPEVRNEIIAAFRSLPSADAASTSAPVVGAAAQGRWSDVYAAVLYACDDAEMAVVRKREFTWGWVFDIRTVEDWPATLIIQRSDSTEGASSIPAGAVHRTGAIYHASAIVGRLHDRSTRAQALLDAFDRHLLAFGRKRGHAE